VGRRVVYRAPTAESIDACAQHICHDLSKKVSDSFDAPDVVWGFAEFLKVVAEIAVKQVNEDLTQSDGDGAEPVDKSDEQQ
jgi:hypothetical protein